MAQFKTKSLRNDPAGIVQTVELWRAGGLVAFPTETVYGLGADACNDAAVAAIFHAKSRPAFNPLIIHVADLETAQRYAVFDDTAQVLAQTFWPGPLSLVLPVLPDGGLSKLVSAGLETVAVRVPDHPLAQKLLREFGGAIAAPSANISGAISPTTAAHVRAGLDGRINAVIDGGACRVGLESTIVMPKDGQTHLLRFGGLPENHLSDALGRKLSTASETPQPLSPGRMKSHYAPNAAVLMNQTSRPDQGLWLGFGADCDGADMNLSPDGNLITAAANLFAFLHQLDALATAQNISTIAVAPIPNTGLGRAINDRLNRAAAARDPQLFRMRNK